MPSAAALQAASAGFPAAPAPFPAIVLASTLVARDIRLVEFGRQDDGLLPDAAAGAHVGVVLPDGSERSYSLVAPASAAQRYAVAVKLEREGRGGSRYLHALNPGDQVLLTEPRNNFPLSDDPAEAVLIAGGIGVTPIWAMAQERAHDDLPWRLIYATRSREDAAFLEELGATGKASFHFDDEHGGAPLDLAAIVATAAADAHFYCCGPLPMLAAFEAATAALPRARVHLEYFAPKEDAATDGGFVLQLARSGREITVKPGQTVLHALRNSGIDMPFSCEKGTCGACEVRVLAGLPDHRDTVLTDAERAANETMMVCCSGARSPTLTLDL